MYKRIMSFQFWVIFILSNLYVFAGHGEYGPVQEMVGFHPNGDYFDAGFEAVVNQFGGNLLVSSTDIEVPSTGGFGLFFRRTHNSHRAFDSEFGVPFLSRDSPLGHGWTSHYGYLVPYYGANPEWVSGTGERETFYRHDVLNSQIPMSGQQVWISPSMKILIKTGSSFDLYTPNGLHYDLAIQTDSTIHKPEKVTDWHGNFWTITYESDSDSVYNEPDVDDLLAIHPLIKSVTDQWGRQLHFTYSASTGKKRISSIELNGTVLSRYTYSTSYSGFRFLVSHITGEGRVTSYSTNTNSAPNAGMGTIESITLPTGGTMSFSYDHQDFSYFQGGSVNRVYAVKTRSFASGTWVYNYDNDPQNSNLKVTVDGPNSFQGIYDYYSYGFNPCTNTLWKIGSLINSTERLIGASIQTKSFTYSPLKITSELLVNLCAEYKQVPRLLTETHTVDNATLVTTYEYGVSDLMYPTKVVSPGFESYFTYQHALKNTGFYLGLPKQTQTKIGSNLIKKTEMLYSGIDEIKPNTVKLFKTTTSYDQVNLTYWQSGTGKLGMVQTKDLGGFGLETYDYFNGALSSIDYPTGVPDTILTINNKGLVARETSMGVTKTYSWDDDLRLTGISQPDASISIIYTSNDVIMSQGNARVSEVYDNWARRETHSERVDGSIVATSSYEYDPFGQIISETVPSGLRYSYSYDILGRITSKNAFSFLDDYTYSYSTQTNGTKTVTTVKNQAVSMLEKSDALGRILLGATNGKMVVYTYSHATNGITLTITPSNQPIRTIKYDFLGQKTEEHHPETGTTSYLYNAAGWNTEESKPELTYTKTYDSIGRPDQLKIGSTVVVDNHYDTTYGVLANQIHGAVNRSFSQFDSMGRAKRFTLSVPEALKGPAITGPVGYLTQDDLGTTPHFTWTAVNNATHYQFELFSQGSIYRQTLTSQGPTTQLLYFSALGFTPVLGNQNSWRVRGYILSSGEIGPWSPLIEFTVETDCDLICAGMEWRTNNLCSPEYTSVGMLVKFVNHDYQCPSTKTSSKKIK